MTFDSPEVGIFYKGPPASKSSIQRQLQRIYLISLCWCCSYNSNCRTKPLWLKGLVQDFQPGDRFVSCLKHIVILEIYNFYKFNDQFCLFAFFVCLFFSSCLLQIG